MKTTSDPAARSQESRLERELHPIFESVRESPVFREYVQGFEKATGRGFEIVFVHDQALRSAAPGGGGCLRRFCDALGTRSQSCQDCQIARRNLASTSTGGIRRVPCVAGFEETFVPVTLGGMVFAWLRTAPVLTAAPTAERFSQVGASLIEEGVDAETWAGLKADYLESPGTSVSEDEGAIALLEIFACLVGTLAREIASQQVHGEPAAMVAARRYIAENLDKPIALEEVAERVSVSPFYLCRLFRRCAGMTMTEYVGRQRVERAKEQLAKSDLQVTEIAFDVGFQSLSQFNRSFLKFTGKSPTGFRAGNRRARQLAV